MVKNVIIDLPEQVVEEARANAFESGSNLKEVVEKAIIATAENAPNGRWVLERRLVEFPWAPSRVTLFYWRKEGKLTEGKDYRRKGKFIYYNAKRLEKLFKKAEAEAPEPAVPAVT